MVEAKINVTNFKAFEAQGRKPGIREDQISIGNHDYEREIPLGAHTRIHKYGKMCIGCELSSSAADEIMLEKNKSLARRIFDYFNRHDLDAIGRVHSANYVAHVAGGQPMDWPAHRQMIEVFYHAFPDFRLNIEDVIGENDKVTIRFTAEGTHQGPFQGISATGKKIKMDGIAIMRFADEERVEEWLAIDSMGLMLQLGAIPSSK